MKLTEKIAQNVVQEWLALRNYERVVPNFTPPGWWECDLWAVTKSMVAHEFEVKITKADFKKDSEKASPSYRTFRREIPAGNKHQQLEQRHPRGPSSFHYVVPAGLITREELPPWAGLIEISPYGERWVLSQVVRAPRLHREKVDPKIVEKLGQTFYYRFWRLRQISKHLPSGPELSDPLQTALTVLQERRRRLELTSAPELPARLAELEAIKEELSEALKDYFTKKNNNENESSEKAEGQVQEG